MLDLLTIPLGLLASLGFAAFCTTVGRAALNGFDPAADAADDERLAVIVLQFGTGLAVVGFGVLILGAVGLLTAPAMLAMAGAALAAIALWRSETRSKDYWRAQLRDLLTAFDWPVVAIVLAFVAVSIGNALPETAFDVTEYHYAYALEWAQAAKIFADPFMTAEPYFANNFQALYAAAFALHLGPYLHFLNWLCGLFAGLTAYALVRTILSRSLPESDRKATVSKGAALAAGLVGVCSPWFLTYLGSAVDIPIGLMTGLPILALVVWRRSGDERALASAAITAGYAIGMKLSLIAMLPLYYGLFFWFLGPVARRRTFAIAGLFTVLASPWYVRNLLAIGDPVPPVFNLLVKGSDPIYSRDDLLRGTKDLQKTRDDGSVLTLPLRLFTHKPDLVYVETGVPAIVTLVYVPFLLVAWCAIRRRRARTPGDDERLMLYGATAYPIAVWLLTATEARYLLESFPLICASLAVGGAGALDRMWDRERTALRGRAAVALLGATGVVAAIPFAGVPVYAQSPPAIVSAMVANQISPKLYLVNYVRGYEEVQYANDLARAARPPGSVLEVGLENLRMYSADQNVPSIGSWAGPGRYFDVIDAAARNALPAYLAAHDVAVAVIDCSGRTVGAKEAAIISTALLRSGFLQVSPPSDSIRVFSRS